MNASTEPPVLASDWDALMANLSARDAIPALAAAPRPVVQGVLAAPTAVARWIAERAPHLRRAAALRLLILGAEKLDAVDSGRWYQAIPWLLGTTQRIEADLVGRELAAGFVSPLETAAPWPAARCHADALAGFLDPARALAFDLAFMFHPGFPKHQGWLRDGSLGRLLAAGVPLVVASYETDEYEMDRWVAECHGFAVAGEPLLNPLFLDFGEPANPVRWARALWQFAPTVPAPGHRVDDERLRALDELGHMVMHSMQSNQVPLQAYGAQVEGQTGDRSQLRLIYVFDCFFVEPQQGAVLAYRDGALQRVAEISPAELASYPGAGATALERAVWAAGIKARHLLPLYAEPVQAAASHAQARAMHADLQDKIEALFRAR
jgi:hypothetical protein